MAEIKELIDTIFDPVIGWLTMIRQTISSMQVPASRGLDVGQYLGPLTSLGPGWTTFITTGIFLGMVYLI
ncbi:hypothetical protein CHH91_17830, partial [Virgibacillus sp. 7505]